ncbi:MAG: YgaP family membrane protein [Halobacteriota archaeon]
MNKNVGGYDRLVRFVIGPILIVVGAAALAGLFTLAAGTLGLVFAAALLLVGAVLTVTAITQKCPLNSVLGFDTYKSESASESAAEDVGTGTRSN